MSSILRVTIALFSCARVDAGSMTSSTKDISICYSPILAIGSMQWVKIRCVVVPL